MTWRDSLAPLRDRRFRYYYGARVVTMLGRSMASVALAFAVLEITGNDPAALGYVLAAHTVPMVLFLLWGGVIADRFSRTLVLQVSNLSSALTQGALAILVVTDVAELWSMIVLSALHGTASAVGFPAMASLLPQLVPRGMLQPANALVSLARSSLVVVGPTVSALLVVSVGPGWALGVDAVTWLVSAVILGLVRLPRPARDGSGPGVLAELREGWSYVRRTTWLWVVVVGFAVLNAITAGAIHTIGPAQAKRTIGEQGWGLVISSEAVGLLLMTVVLLRVPLKRPLLLGMLGMSVEGVFIILLGAEPHLLLLMGVMLLAGAGSEVFSMGWNLAMQEHVPESMLSRAYSYDALGSFAAMPVGQIAFGPMAAVFGYREVLVVSGVVSLLVCGLVLCSRSVRTLPRAVTAEQVTPTSWPGLR